MSAFTEVAEMKTKSSEKGFYYFQSNVLAVRYHAIVNEIENWKTPVKTSTSIDEKEKVEDSETQCCSGTEYYLLGNLRV